jgi:uncharacterized membrane protein
MNASRDTGDKITPPRSALPGAIDLLIWAIIALQLLIAVYGFVTLPETVPIHWGVNGQVNGYGPKWVGTFLYPLMSVGIYLLIRLLLVAGPRLGGREATTANLQITKLIIVGVLLLMLVIQLATLAQMKGMGFDMSLVVTLAMSVLFIFLGNYMGKVRRNFWVGIRTPWTISSEVVWERTHRVGSWLFVIIGLIGIPCSFVPILRLWGLLIPLLLVLVFLVFYSYICYQQQMQQDQEKLSPPFDDQQ